jgi:hypothetical protein
MLLLVQVLEDRLAELELLGVCFASVLPAFGRLQDRSSISRRRNLTLGAVERVRVLALWSTTCARRASNGPRLLDELRRLDLVTTVTSPVGAKSKKSSPLQGPACSSMPC